MKHHENDRAKKVLRRGLVSFISCLCVLFALNGLAASEEPDAASTSPRQLYNDGTQKLKDGKLQEAEACLQSAVASQEARVQGPALYNLGETRFQQGVQELKKAPSPKAMTDVSKRASSDATGALEAIDKAMVSEDVQAMVDAYYRGRGARKELKDAINAVKSAMETYGQVLAKWQRASGDFKSDFELTPADIDAKTNADIVDQHIARLVDSHQMMMQMMQGMANQRSELGKKMKELKKKMPGGEGDKLKGGADDEDDDDDNGGKKPPELKDGMEEPGQKNEGQQMVLSYEEAARLLDMLKLDANRKLSLGGTNEAAMPKDRKGRDW
ncbi:MAG TPA: hypothetical protein VFB72_11175 [Verrucomicrobiae bacterium]|nr:hypothetical protein [Verrucomicrobiae bacterium]